MKIPSLRLLLLGACLCQRLDPAASAGPLVDGSTEDQAKTDDVVDIRSWNDAKDPYPYRSKVDEKAAAAMGVRPEDIELPKKTHNETPLYPKSALDARQQGVVILDCRIDPDGTTKNCKIVKGSLNEDLNAAALACVQKWRYRPLRIRGQARAALTRLFVNFRLN
ncbi:MAG TPA: energy transducer TonB [Vicinamibacteria bacterium]|nr:energy transducer TonB [Vicinamibacteria bacterium]